MKQWQDIQDQDGYWKIGYIIKDQPISTKITKSTQKLKIRYDGYSPAFDTFYCKHSQKIFPVRTYTMGFNTYPMSHKVIRDVLTLDQIKYAHNRLNLISRMQNLLQATQENLKIFMRTQLLVLVDKIVKTPFQLINTLKMCDLWINKLFIAIINFYLKILQYSKKFLPLIQSQNKMARQLFLVMYEFNIMTKIIIGSHKNSKLFFEDPTNLTIKKDGFIDCFIMADNGILLFKFFFKNISTMMLSKLQPKQIDVIFSVIQLFIDLCQNSKGELYEIKFINQTKVVIDQIISFIKVFTGLSDVNLNMMKLKMDIISRLENIQIKIRPKKVINLKSQIFYDHQKDKKNQQYQKEKQLQKEINKNIQKERQNAEILLKSQANQQIQSLKHRVQKLEQLLGGLVNQKQKIFSSNNNQNQILSKDQIKLRTKNLGQEQFLASLTWALQCGDLQTCKKLVSWRQNLLKLGRIVGWEIALQIGTRTMKKAQITSEDIINTNVDFLRKAQLNQFKNQEKQQKQKLFDPLSKIILANNKSKVNQYEAERG